MRVSFSWVVALCFLRFFCMNDIIFNGRQVCAQLGNSVYAIQTVSGMWHCGPCQVGLLLKTFKHNVTSKVNALNHP